MPKKVEKYTVFVASPSDVRDERESMDEVISELNNTYGNRSNVLIELVKWETHSAPAASITDTQDVIDTDIGFDYDIFIGILWMKFGTPTLNYASGTSHEFEEAYSRFKKNPKSLQILFYFKTSPPVSLTDINPSQLEKVNSFKKQLGEKSILYWEYDTIDDLQKFLRIHLPKRIDNLRRLNDNDNNIQEVTKEVKIQNNNEIEELGLFDYQEFFIDSFSDSSQALLRITDATTWVGNEINKKAAELRSLNAKKNEIGRKESRDFYRRTAEIMNDFASRIEPDIPIYINSFERGADAFSNMLAIYQTDFNKGNLEDIKTNVADINNLIENIGSASTGMQNFLDSISSLPRIAKELNQARNNVETKLKELINKLEISISIASELSKNVDSIY